MIKGSSRPDLLLICQLALRNLAISLLRYFARLVLLSVQLNLFPVSSDFRETRCRVQLNPSRPKD